MSRSFRGVPHAGSAPFLTNGKGTEMKKLLIAATIASFGALAACSGGGDDQKAENIEATAENQADALEMQADNTTNEAASDALETQADAVEEKGEEKAEAVDDTDGAANATNGM